MDVPMVAHDFPLRPDLMIRIVLPRHLTSADAERLIGFVRTLAFGDKRAAKPPADTSWLHRESA